ncbi:MAG: phosphatidate cytidylyltransferase [Bacteroidota bacterium]
MKTQLLSAFLLTFIFFLTSCEVIGGIFKAGVWVGVVVVVGILALVGVLIGKSKK